MLTGNTTFGRGEVEGQLIEDGYKPSTTEFTNELKRRFWPVEGQENLFFERDDWQGDRQKCQTR